MSEDRSHASSPTRAAGSPDQAASSESLSYARPAEVPPTDATGGLIPYMNAPALVAYYCGVFAVIPFFPIGLAGLVLGLLGLRNYRRQPSVRGRVHAWIGILLGGFFGLFWLMVTVMVIAGILW